MKNLTREQAIKEHRKMWNWIAESYEQGNTWNITKAKQAYFEENELGSLKTGHCFLCEYAYEKYIEEGSLEVKNRCDFCPLSFKHNIFESELESYCSSQGSLYRIIYDFSCSINLKQQESFRKALAGLCRTIANLDERTETKKGCETFVCIPSILD